MGVPSLIVTGASGFLGSWIVDVALRYNLNVTAQVRKTSSTRWLDHHSQLQTFTSALDNGPELTTGLAPFGIVIHNAGVVKGLNRNDYYLGNEKIAETLVSALNQLTEPKTIIVISSQAAAGPTTSPKFLDGNDPCHPVSMYGKSKLACEQIFRNLNQQHRLVNIRPSSVYGPRDIAFYDYIQAG